MTEETVHQMTVRFNALVAVATERGVARWAKHHKSDFGSRQMAADQIARLQKELGIKPDTIMALAAEQPEPGPGEVAEAMAEDEEGILPEDGRAAEGLREAGPVITQAPLVNWTTTIKWGDLSGGGQATCKQQARDWQSAARLALGAVTLDKLVPGAPGHITLDIKLD